MREPVDQSNDANEDDSESVPIQQIIPPGHEQEMVPGGHMEDMVQGGHMEDVSISEEMADIDDNMANPIQSVTVERIGKKIIHPRPLESPGKNVKNQY